MVTANHTSQRHDKTDTPILLVPYGSADEAVASVTHFLWDEFRVSPAIWSSGTLPNDQHISVEKRFLAIVAGSEIARGNQKTRGTRNANGLDQLCRVVARTPTANGVIISQTDAPKPLALKAVKLDADALWKQQFTDELTNAKAVVHPSALPARLTSLLRKLNENLLEREEAVRLCVLATLARESVFLLGPPGVAKSLIARRLKELFTRDAKAFEYLMNRFSTPDEIFGPVSIQGLKDDHLLRKTEAYLPGADVVFLDEIWKAGPSIQNALLTAINERIFRNDGVDQPIPLRALISASNELPAEDEGLEALWDRFLVRLEVDNIDKPENRRVLIRGSSQMGVVVEDEERFDKRELHALDHQVDNVSIPDEVMAIIEGLIPRVKQFNQDLAEKRAEEKKSYKLSVNSPNVRAPDRLREMHVSDRRWKKIGRLMRTSALCNGRFAVNELDCYLIYYCIWNDQDHVKPALEMVKAAIESGFGVAELKDRWRRLQIKAQSLPSTDHMPPTSYGDHYKIDLSKNGALLSDPEFGDFRKLPKEAYLSLTATFQPIQLRGTGKRQAKVLAKLGSSPQYITLKKDDKSPPLKPFAATEFGLTYTSETTKKSIANRSSDAARAYLFELEEFRARLEAQRQSRESLLAEHSHLFVNLSPELLDRLSDISLKANQELDRLSQDVSTFAKGKGLE